MKKTNKQSITNKNENMKKTDIRKILNQTGNMKKNVRKILH